MKKSLLELYALAVCFAAVICFVSSSGIALYSVVAIINPEFTISAFEYKQYQSNDTYWQQHKYEFATKGREIQRPPEDELTKKRKEGYELAVIAEKRSGLQTLTKTLIVIMIDIVVFLIHWLIARRARETNSAA